MSWLIKLQRRFHMCIYAYLFLSGCAVPYHSPLLEQRAQEMVDRGVVHLRSGAYDQAQASFRVAIEAAQTPAAYDGLGCAFFLMGKNKEAEEIFIKVLSWFPKYAPTRANLALLYDLKGNHHQAITLYKEALRLDPLSYKVRNNYGALLLNSRQRKAKSLGQGYLVDAHVIADHPIIRANLESIRYTNMEHTNE